MKTTSTSRPSCPMIDSIQRIRSGGVLPTSRFDDPTSVPLSRNSDRSKSMPARLGMKRSYPDGIGLATAARRPVFDRVSLSRVHTHGSTNVLHGRLVCSTEYKSLEFMLHKICINDIDDVMMMISGPWGKKREYEPPPPPPPPRPLLRWARFFRTGGDLGYDGFVIQAKRAQMCVPACRVCPPPPPTHTHRGTSKAKTYIRTNGAKHTFEM